MTNVTHSHLIECGPSFTRSRSVSWNASGSFLGMACFDGTVRLWTLDSSSTSSLSSTIASSSPTAFATAATVSTNNTTVGATGVAASGGNGNSNTTTSSAGSGAKEVVSLTGHTAPVTTVEFHPRHDKILLSGSTDGTVLFWDVRSSTPKQTGKVDLNHSASTTSTHSSTTPSHSNRSSNRNSNTGSSSSSSSVSANTVNKHATTPTIVSTQWNPVQTHMVAVATRDGTVAIYDTRKLAAVSYTTHASTAASAALTTTAVHCKHTLAPVASAMETCIFDPTGTYLIAGTTSNQGHGMGYLQVWDWKQGVLNPSLLLRGESVGLKSAATTTRTVSPAPCPSLPTRLQTFPAHAGPVYALACSRHSLSDTAGTAATAQKRFLVTGGADAVVGIWHGPTMTCAHTHTTRTKFIRSVAIAPDDRVVAIATEEACIELLDPVASLTDPGGSSSSSSSLGLVSFGPRPRSSGADDVAFHPTASYVLACARVDMGSMSMAPVTVMKLTLSL